MIRRSIMRGTALAAASAALALASAACTAAPTDGAAPRITVAAAASLTDVFEAIGAEFTQDTGIEVTFSFAASSAIAEQIRGGAPIDAFASAGTSAMEPLVAEQLVTGVTSFASNSLTIAVPVGNPGAVSSLADLGRVSVVVCEEQVPCGVATATLFDRSALDVAPVSYEPDVRSVLGKIVADEADAGIVYVTDTAGRADVESIAIPPNANVSTTYQAAVVTASTRADAAAAFVAYLTGPEAQGVLAAAGFARAP